MRIFAYRVIQCGPRSLESIADGLQALPLAKRFSGGSDVRMDNRARGRSTGFVAMDFVRQRGGHGPGRMSPTAALSTIRLAADENFGEDTGLVYDPSSGYAAVQYNHYGPRAAAIENYLFAYDLSLGGLRAKAAGEKDSDVCGFRFGALLKPDAYKRLQKLGIIHELEFSVAVPGARRADLDQGQSLAQILAAPLPEGIETISISMKAAAGRNTELGRKGALGIVNDIQRLGDDVKRAVVRGKAQPGDPMEKVDLVDERIYKDVTLQLGSGRRYSQRDRWNALTDTLKNWLSSGELPGVQ